MRQKTQTASSVTDASSATTNSIFEGTYEQPVDYNDPLLVQRKVVLTTNLNPHSTRKVVSKLLYLNRDASTKPIDLYLRTNGGKYSDAFAIIDTMHLIKAPVNVWAVGGCWSAGAIILASATGKRYATRNAQIMVHANLYYGTGSDSFIEEDKSNKDRVEGVFRSRTHLPSNWYPLSGNRAYYLDAPTAKKYGLIDEIR